MSRGRRSKNKDNGVPAGHPQENNPEHRAFLIRSLERNDKDLAAVMETNRALRQVKQAVVDACGEEILLDMGCGDLRLVNDELMSNRQHQLTPVQKQICGRFLELMKLRRKLCNRLARRLNRVAHAMDGQDVKPPPAPKYGELRLSIDRADIQASMQRRSELETAKATVDPLIKAHSVTDQLAVLPASPAVVKSLPGNAVASTTNGNGSHSNPPRSALDTAPSAKTKTLVSLGAVQPPPYLPKDILELVREYDDAYEKRWDPKTNKTRYTINETKAEDDFDSIKTSGGIGAVHGSMSAKEKEMEHKRWTTAVLSRIHDQPTFADLGLDTRVFHLSARRKRCLEETRATDEKPQQGDTKRTKSNTPGEAVDIDNENENGQKQEQDQTTEDNTKTESHHDFEADRENDAGSQDAAEGKLKTDTEHAPAISDTTEVKADDVNHRQADVKTESDNKRTGAEQSSNDKMDTVAHVPKSPPHQAIVQQPDPLVKFATDRTDQAGKDEHGRAEYGDRVKDDADKLTTVDKDANDSSEDHFEVYSKQDESAENSERNTSKEDIADGHAQENCVEKHEDDESKEESRQGHESDDSSGRVQDGETRKVRGDPSIKELGDNKERSPQSGSEAKDMDVDEASKDEGGDVDSVDERKSKDGKTDSSNLEDSASKDEAEIRKPQQEKSDANHTHSEKAGADRVEKPNEEAGVVSSNKFRDESTESSTDTDPKTNDGKNNELEASTAEHGGAGDQAIVDSAALERDSEKKLSTNVKLEKETDGANPSDETGSGKSVNAASDGSDGEIGRQEDAMEIEEEDGAVTDSNDKDRDEARGQDAVTTAAKADDDKVNDGNEDEKKDEIDSAADDGSDRSGTDNRANEDEGRDGEQEGEDHVERPKRIKPMNLGAIPSFYDQDLRRIRLVHSDIMSASIKEHAQRKLAEVTRDYNAAFQMSSRCQERIRALEHQINLNRQESRQKLAKINNEYSYQVKMKKKQWLKEKRDFDTRQAKSMFPSTFGHNPLGTRTTQNFVRVGGLAGVIGTCIADLVDATVMIGEGKARRPTKFGGFVPPPAPPELSSTSGESLVQKATRLDEQLRRQHQEYLSRLKQSEEDRKRAWKKVLKTKAEFDLPHGSHGRRVGRVDQSNYHMVPMPALKPGAVQAMSPSPTVGSRPESRQHTPTPASSGGSQSKYSAARVRARIAVDGSVAPVTEPKRNKDGLYMRPAGRTRKGMQWDPVRGIWVPE